MYDQRFPQSQQLVNEKPVQRMKSLQTAVKSHRDKLAGYSETWSENLDKLAAKMHLYETELITTNDNEDLCVYGQIRLENTIDSAMNLNNEYMRQHKNMHNSVSKVGKNVERNFVRDVGGYFLREKDLVCDQIHRKNTCSMIYDFLLSEGCLDIAETLKKEASLNTKQPVDNRVAFNRILNDIQRHEICSALRYLNEMAPHEARLRYDLQKQHVLQLVIAGKEKEAQNTLKELRYLGNDNDTPLILGAVLLGKAAMEMERYKRLFDEKLWDSLVQRMADVMSSTRSNMTNIIETGRQTVSVLSGLKKNFGKSIHSYDEELPTEVKVKRQIHSTFTCPILKEQSTPRNPPMKLLCGHVISREAMQNLAASRVINTRVQMPRQHRFKCPYCPREQTSETAKQVLFSHVQF